MPFLNLETGILLYADTNVENPKVRLADITDTFQQVTISNVKSAETVVSVGETKTIVSTRRSLAPSIATAACVFVRPIDNVDVMRLSVSSIANAFRTKRNIGVDVTSHVSVTRVGPRSLKIGSLAGTPISTSEITVGDQLWIERNSDNYTNCFTEYNCDKLLTVQSVGTDSFVVNDEGFLVEEPDVELGSLFDSAFKVLARPTIETPKVDDYIKIAGNFNYYNKGVFKILRITDNYVEYANPYGVIESVTNTTTGLAIFDYFIRFVHLVASGELEIGVDGNPAVITTSPLDAEKSQFTATLKATEITVTNNTLNPIVLRCQSAGSLGE
jgi:hypothetical protein